MAAYKPKLLWISIASAVMVFAGYLLYSRNKAHAGAEYDEIKPQRGSIRVTVSSTGIVEPQGRIELKPPVPGRMESVLVREGQKVRRGQILAWMSSTERAALLDAARAVSAEEYKSFQEFYKATPIVAPISGTIILRNAEPGQTVSSADVLLVIADRLQVVAKVDETDIARVTTGMAAEILLDAYPEQQIEARVSAIAFEAKTVNNVTTYDVEVIPKAQPAFMRSGMTANVTFILKKKEDVLTLPLSAIQFRKDTPFVLVKSPKDKPEEVLILLGDSDGSNTEITSGLNEAQTVLVPKIKANTGKQAGNPFMPARNNRSGSGRSAQRVH